MKFYYLYNVNAVLSKIALYALEPSRCQHTSLTHKHNALILLTTMTTLRVALCNIFTVASSELYVSR